MKLDNIYAEQESQTDRGAYECATIQQKLRDASHDDFISVWRCQNLMSEAADCLDAADALDGDEKEMLKEEQG